MKTRITTTAGLTGMLLTLTMFTGILAATEPIPGSACEPVVTTTVLSTPYLNSTTQTETGGLSEYDVTMIDYDGPLEEYLASAGWTAAGSRPAVYSILPINADGQTPDGSDDYAYNLLSESQKNLYDSIESTLAAFVASEAYQKDLTSDTASLGVATAEGSSMEMMDAYHAFLSFFYDNPQYYWVDGATSVATANDGTAVTLSVDSDYWSYELRSTTDSKIQSVSAEWLEELGKIKNDNNEEDEAEDTYEIALRLHDLIIEQIDYKYDSPNNPAEGKYAHSIGGVFTGTGAVCEGYAKAYQYILNCLGIENIYIVGMADGGGHAWNSVKIGEDYYLVDVTWDDANNGTDDSEEPLVFYDYFCIPENLFDDKHTPFRSNGTNTWLYDLPDFTDNTTYVYYNYYDSHANGNYNSDTIGSFVSNALASARGDYVYFQASSTATLSLIFGYLNVSEWGYRQNPFGYLAIYQNIEISKIATAITLTNTNITKNDVDELQLPLEIGASETILAALTPDDSDDRIKWEISDPLIASLQVTSSGASVTGKKNGTVTLTATASGGKISVSCSIIVGSGKQTKDYTIWANGNTANKSVTITPTIAAGTWQDARGRSKKGKLVWLVKEQKTEISFDETKHTVLTKSDKNCASVSGKGKVTAKKPGTVYVYVCDTASLSYEVYEIEILQAPTKLYVSSVAGSTEKTNLMTKASVDVGETSTAYIVPFVKNAVTDSSATYTITFVKPEQSQYLTVSEVTQDEAGNPYFTITGKAYDTAKNKPASVRISIMNTESGKKLSCTIQVGNPVTSVSASTSGTSLAEKKSTVTLTLALTTAAGSGYTTTDKVKVYVARTKATLSGKRVTVDTGASIRAKYNKDGTVTLTASKDAGIPAVIYIAYTDAVTKEIKLYELARINEAGSFVTEE